MATINPSNQQITNHAIQVGAANNLLTSLAVGSTGTVLQGNTGADPSFSTATYPSTAGTSGNLITSDGTNFTSASPAALLTASATLTAAQIRSLNASPVTLIAAPGAGKQINVVAVCYLFTYGGTNVFTAGSNIVGYIGTTVAGGYTIGTTIPVTVVTGSATSSGNKISANTATSSGNNLTNLPFIIGASSTEYGGNAANDNTIKVQVFYFVTSMS